LSISFIANYLIKKAKKTPYTHIYGESDKKLYMERYWLLNPIIPELHKTKYSWFPLSIRIHKIVKPDNDRNLHDHPWNCRSFILKGWYVERRILNDIFIRSKGQSSRLNFKEYHRIETVCPEGVYTIFVTGKYQGTWGFLVNGIKINYKDYLKNLK
jgi:hypothetical protein